MGENTNPTQCNRLLDYMKSHESVTQMDAWSKLGIMRLASRISDLRKRGFVIERKMKTVKNRYGEKCSVASYKLVDF